MIDLIVSNLFLSWLSIFILDKITINLQFRNIIRRHYFHKYSRFTVIYYFTLTKKGAKNKLVAISEHKHEKLPPTRQ